MKYEPLPVDLRHPACPPCTPVAPILNLDANFVAFSPASRTRTARRAREILIRDRPSDATTLQNALSTVLAVKQKRRDIKNTDRRSNGYESIVTLRISSNRVRICGDTEGARSFDKYFNGQLFIRDFARYACDEIRYFLAYDARANPARSIILRITGRRERLGGGKVCFVNCVAKFRRCSSWRQCADAYSERGSSYSYAHLLNRRVACRCECEWNLLAPRLFIFSHCGRYSCHGYVSSA